MKTQIPVIRQMSWRLAIPQFIVLGLLTIVSTVLFFERYGPAAPALGALVYLTYSYSSRWLLLRHHRHGMEQTRQGNNLKAINEFEKSYEFLSKHLWIDTYRFLTMMSPAQQSYREMALINIAFCYAQLGDKERTIAYYERTLQEFPNNSMAQAALNFVQTIEDKT